MAIIPLYLGEAVHHAKCGTFRWRPDGAVYRYQPSGADGAEARDIEDFGAEGARLFVGFNVGGRPAWTLQQVADAVYAIRKKQGASGDASFLLQRGIYEAAGGERIDEDAAQVILLNLTGEADFVQNMLKLGESLRIALKQERVIIEIQKGGVVEHMYSATDPRE